jgi:predicted RecB family nuclease
MITRINATDFSTLYLPSKCERRVYLRSKGESESKPSEFAKFIKALGEQHELEHLLQFEKYTDLSKWNLRDRVRKTIRSVIEGLPVIYQGAFIVKLPSKNVEVVGTPDFLIKDDDSYKIRICSLPTKVDESHNQEILLQLELYGWLFENTFKKRPTKLEIYSGDKIIKEFEYTGGESALKELDEIISIYAMEEEPQTLVEWSKCFGCVFMERCWKKKESKK